MCINKGYYMGVTSNNGNSNEPASFYSSEFPSSYTTCTLTFWHTIYGYGNSLNVSIYLHNDRKITIFRRDSNSPATDWTQASINLGILLFFSV